MDWDAIVCTCQNRESANAIYKELLVRQNLKIISPKTLLLTVDDPQTNIGSGSAALNALLCTAERISAQTGYTSIDNNALSNSRILILLLGTTFPVSACGHAFMPHPDTQSSSDDFKHNLMYTNMDNLLDLLKKLIPSNSPNGVWICNTDMLLMPQAKLDPLDISDVVGHKIGVLTVKATPQHATHHGTCQLTAGGDFKSIMYKGALEEVKKMADDNGQVDMIAGIAYLTPEVAEVFVSFHIFPPLDSCTYIALDSGAKPVSVSLFYDILMCLTTDMTLPDYEEGKYISSTTLQMHTTGEAVLLRKLRRTLWKHMVQSRKISMKAIPLHNVEHSYLKYNAQDVIHRYFSFKRSQNDKYVVLNSRLPKGIDIGDGSLLIGCDFVQPYIKIGQNCFVSGVSGSLLIPVQSLGSYHCLIPDNIALQELRVSVGFGKKRHKMTVMTICGIQDDLKLSTQSPGMTFCNEPWKAFLERTGIVDTDLWPSDFPESKKTLMSARLFPAAHPNVEVGIAEVFWLIGNVKDPLKLILARWRSSWRLSLKEVLQCVDTEAELARQRRLFYELQVTKMMDVLVQGTDVCLTDLFQTAVAMNYQDHLLESLDKAVELAQEKNASPGGSFSLACRIYSCIADVMSYTAGSTVIRSGPASNASWREAFALLDAAELTGNLIPATRALATERKKWMNNGMDTIVRAARHYEKAAQTITLIIVNTVTKHMKVTPLLNPSLAAKTVVTAPVRIDIAGGWSDTPPQAYEHGGKVCTLAIKLKGERPVRSTVKRIPEMKIVVIWGDGWTDVLSELSDFSDYSQPRASAALLKCALICSGIVDYPSNDSLEKQLKEKFGCGFELKSSANVPLGSGLGTSGILSSCVLASLYHATGRQCDRSSLVHATLKVEQMLTSGGGWQDQIGGLYPGAKISESPRNPSQLVVKTDEISVPDGFMAKLNRHLHLVYTGRTRLAKNLLQDVLRRWHSRESTVVTTMRGLVENAEHAKTAFEKGDLCGLGASLANAQRHKLVMAPGSLPTSVQSLVERIKNDIYGYMLAGAGGGGFLAIIAKKEGFGSKLQVIIAGSLDFEQFEIFPTEVDLEGLAYQNE